MWAEAGSRRALYYSKRAGLDPPVKEPHEVLAREGHNRTGPSEGSSGCGLENALEDGRPGAGPEQT